MNIFDMDFILALIVATILGGILGFEREIHGRPAGLRTHLLVSLGSAAFMLLSPFVAEMGKGIPTDPGRIAAQIVTGIGFLGAGAIVKEGITVRGLTTAACLWIAAAIGMTAGAGRYMGAVLITAIALFALVLLPRLESRLKTHSYRVLEVITPLEVDVSAIIKVIKAQDITILRYEMDRNYVEETLKTSILLRLYHHEVTDSYAHKIVEALEEVKISPQQIIWRLR